jgi:hypothetical protein
MLALIQSVILRIDALARKPRREPMTSVRALVLGVLAGPIGLLGTAQMISSEISGLGRPDWAIALFQLAMISFVLGLADAGMVVIKPRVGALLLSAAAVGLLPSVIGLLPSIHLYTLPAVSLFSLAAWQSHVAAEGSSISFGT